MYEEMESWIDGCPDLDHTVAMQFLQAWLSDMENEPRKLHYKALQKRHEAGNMIAVATWVEAAAAHLPPTSPAAPQGQK